MTDNKADFTQGSILKKLCRFMLPVLGGAAVVFTILAAVLFVLLVGFARPIAVLMQAPEAPLRTTRESRTPTISSSSSRS